MANYNAIIPFGKINPKELQETLGITQFNVGGDPFAWHQTIGGILFQGSFLVGLATDSSTVVPFIVPFTKTILWIGLTVDKPTTGVAIAPSLTGVATLTDFTLDINTEGGFTEDANIWWFALGV